MVQSLSLKKPYTIDEKFLPKEKEKEKLDQIKMPPLNIEKSREINTNNLNNDNNREDIVLIPTPIDYEEFMRMQYSNSQIQTTKEKGFLKDIPNNQNNFLLNNFTLPLSNEININNNNNNNKEINSFNNFNFPLVQDKNLFNYANLISQNSQNDMGILNVNNNINNEKINFMEIKNQNPLKINFNNTLNNDIDVKKFMKMQEDDIQKYFDKINKLEYDKVYNKINNLNKEQEVFNKIKNSNGEINFNEVWRDFQINNTNRVKIFFNF